MITIQLREEVLDIYSQDIEWSSTAFRFSEGLADPFSTDIELPKTTKNLRILNASGLLDSVEQPLGYQISPAVMTLGSKVMDIYIQVVSVTEDKISICLFETALSERIREGDIKNLLKDDEDSIYAWNVNSRAYPDFRYYNYGMDYMPNYAQLHPSRHLDDLILRLNESYNLELPYSDTPRYVISTNKTLCPENRHQSIEGYSGDDKEPMLMLSGGQHITNDLEYRSEPDEDYNRVTFNRRCKVKVKCWASWLGKAVSSYGISFSIYKHFAGEDKNKTFYFNMPNDSYRSGHILCECSFDINEGDFIVFAAAGKYEWVRMYAELEIKDYEITEEDYGQELEYIGRTPHLGVFDRISNEIINVNADASKVIYGWWKRGIGVDYERHSVTLPYASFAWFGYFCNLNDLKIKELLYGLCSVTGNKIRKRHIVDTYGIYTLTELVPANDCKEISGRITDTLISSDRLGRKNYLMFEGQDETNSKPVSSISNLWLEDTKTLMKCPFWNTHTGNIFYKLDQYSNPEYDVERDEYSCDFNETGFAVTGDWDSLNQKLRNLRMPSFGFENLTQSIEVTIETDEDAEGKDFLYLDGRKYMVVSVDKDLNSGKSTVRALLMK